MTMPRRLLVDVEVTRHYHCISRCVRRAFLCGEGFEHRKALIEARIEFLSSQFAISICGFAVLDNHLHILCRLDPSTADGWSDEEVVRRWVAVYSPSCLKNASPESLEAWIREASLDTDRVALLRQRLHNLGWFMKALKEPVARQANKEDDIHGAFWEARYKSIAILDEAALLATCAYIDLNPVAAGIAEVPEGSPHTSIKQRVDHVRTAGTLETVLLAAERGSVVAAGIEADIEQSLWLCPVQDRSQHGANREGMLAGFSLAGYLELLDWTSRLCRAGKARISRAVAGVMERLGTSTECWQSHIRKLLGKARWCGCYCATRASSLEAIALRRGLRRVNNTLGAVAAA